jgi:hypothetical protein
MAAVRKIKLILCSNCEEYGIRGKGDLCDECYKSEYKKMKRILAKRNKTIRVSED